MTSRKQVEANRQNALRSTGPKTEHGKARVAQNALAHGLLSQETLLSDEDPQALELLAEAMRIEFRPKGTHEHFLVNIMIRARWRLQRLSRVEAGIFAWEHYGILVDRATREAKLYEESEDAFMPSITHPRKHTQAMVRVNQITAVRDESPAATIGHTFIRGSSGVDAFAKLSRYEATIERSYYRACHELERLQRARLGEYVPAPLALDVTVNGGADSARPGGATTGGATEGARQARSRGPGAHGEFCETNPEPGP